MSPLHLHFSVHYLDAGFLGAADVVITADVSLYCPDLSGSREELGSNA